MAYLHGPINLLIELLLGEGQREQSKCAIFSVCPALAPVASVASAVVSFGNSTKLLYHHYYHELDVHCYDISIPHIITTNTPEPPSSTNFLPLLKCHQTKGVRDRPTPRLPVYNYNKKNNKKKTQKKVVI